jgi:energy-coupling factor transporter ATP-binding protein EcfA2
VARRKRTIRHSDRYAVIGATGCGKTWLVRELINKIAIGTNGDIPIIIIDSKQEGDFDGFLQPGIGMVHEGNNIPDVHAIDDHYIHIWQPVYDDFEMYEAFFEKMYYEKKPAMIVIDELSNICKGTSGLQIPRYYDVLQKQGRARGGGIGLITCTQAPTYVPANLFRQATHIFRFRLPDPYDTKKLDGMTGKTGEPGDEFGFFYKDTRKPIKTLPTKYYKDMQEFFGI